jgi:hypothetical protein
VLYVIDHYSQGRAMSAVQVFQSLTPTEPECINAIRANSLFTAFDSEYIVAMHAISSLIPT